MSFLTGQTERISTTPDDVSGFRRMLEQFLQQQGLGTALHGADQGVDTAPYRDMFAQRRREALAQARESAGNLTGSGLANLIGTAAGRSVTEENAFLANLMENARQRSADRFTSLIGQIPGLSSPDVVGYQPGFLDYLFQGVSAAAPIAGAAIGRRP